MKTLAAIKTCYEAFCRQLKNTHGHMLVLACRPGFSQIVHKDYDTDEHADNVGTLTYAQRFRPLVSPEREAGAGAGIGILG